MSFHQNFKIAIFAKFAKILQKFAKFTIASCAPFFKTDQSKAMILLWPVFKNVKIDFFVNFDIFINFQKWKFIKFSARSAKVITADSWLAARLARLIYRFEKWGTILSRYLPEPSLHLCCAKEASTF